MMNHSEMRKRTRVRIEASVNLAGPDTTLFNLPIKDLSLKGVFVETGMCWEKGTEVDISLEMTGDDFHGLDVNMKGRVVRREPEGLAIDFVEIDLDSFFHLKNIVFYNAEDPSLVEKEFSSKPAFR